MDFDQLLRGCILIVGVGCFAYFIFNLVKLIFPDQELLAAQARLGVESANRQYRHWSLRFLAPFFKALVPRIQQFKMPIYRQQKKKQFLFMKRP